MLTAIITAMLYITLFISVCVIIFMVIFYIPYRVARLIVAGIKFFYAYLMLQLTRKQHEKTNMRNVLKETERILNE